MDILTTLGIDWRLFTAQAINFVVLLALLHRFLYKPMLRFLDERSARIAEGIRAADELAAREHALEEERHRIVTDARREAERIVSAALIDAEESRNTIVEQARVDAQRIIAEGNAALIEQERMVAQELRKETAALVVDATRKIFYEMGSKEVSGAVLEEAVHRLGRA